MTIPRSRRKHVVAIYELDQAFGGPEEGGWWYGTGECVRRLRMFGDEETASQFCRRVNRLLAHRRNNLGADVRYLPLSSVAYAGGHYEAQVHEGSAPSSYPNHRPHYE